MKDLEKKRAITQANKRSKETDKVVNMAKKSFGNKQLKFHHSGHLGDIIYGLPTIKRLGGGILYIDHTLKLPAKAPLGLEKAELIIELLKTQPYLDEVLLYKEGWTTDHNLDRFRHVGSSIYRDHLALSHWKGIGMKTKLDLSKPWLENIDKNHMEDIVISRSTRRFENTDFSPLRKYSDRCVFLGFTNEWQKWEKLTKGIGRHHKVKSLLEFAQIVAGCKFYVGNQSFGLSLAEGLKVPRFCELHRDGPNCPPQSSNGHKQLTEEILTKYL